MIKGKHILGVIPARGGSKGLRKKNIYPLYGKPLISYTADVVNQLDWLDKVIVSTDCKEIASVSAALGLEVPFQRPVQLSGDRVSDWAVLNHALEFVESKDNQKYEIILLLQPTSPFRDIKDIYLAVEMLIDNEFDSVWTVSASNSKTHPLKQLVVEQGRLEYYDKRGADIIARQELSSLYNRNGVAYVVSRECILESQSTKGSRAGAYLIQKPTISIDTLDDIQYAEYLLSTRKVGLSNER